MQHENNNSPKLIIMVLAVFTLKIFDTKVAAVLIVIKKFHEIVWAQIYIFGC